MSGWDRLRLVCGAGMSHRGEPCHQPVGDTALGVTAPSAQAMLSVVLDPSTVAFSPSPPSLS